MIGTYGMLTISVSQQSSTVISFIQRTGRVDDSKGKIGLYREVKEILGGKQQLLVLWSVDLGFSRMIQFDASKAVSVVVRD